MKVRYSVEGRFSATFTASKIVKDMGEAVRVCISLGLLNLKEGYKKYSNPILYDDQNNVIERMSEFVK